MKLQSPARASLARLGLLLAILVLNACATQAPANRAPVQTREAAPATLPGGGTAALPPLPGDETPGTGGAGASGPLPPTAPVVTPAGSLLASVDEAIAAGRLEQAAALCERALRISPRDAYLWYRLAAIRFQQQRYADAAGFARRALSNAGSDARLRQAITQLLEQTEAAHNATSS